MESASRSEQTLDRARGALVGLAVGDALGTTLEFSHRDSLPHHTEMIGGGPFDLPPGVWTDDTSMALALAESLIDRGGLDAADLMDRFVRWWRHGAYSATGTCFDIGTTTRQALHRYTRTGDPFAGQTGEDTAGNGSIMRLAPVALHALEDEAACARIAAAQSRTTHAAPQAVEACVFLAEILRRAILGAPREAILAPMARLGHPAMTALSAGDWRGRPRAEVRASGYVIDTLGAALWAVDQTDSFEAAVVLAVNLGQDADTTGAVTGQIAGALYGYDAIPRRWLETLAWRERILGLADALLAG